MFILFTCDLIVVFIRENNISDSELKHLEEVHILRLNLGWNKNNSVHFHFANRYKCLNIAPFVWVFDDDYIPASVFLQVQGNKMTTYRDSSVWVVQSRVREREANILCAMENSPGNSILMDFYRLDILLEDYLDEAIIHNQFVSENNSLVMKPKPIIDTYKLIHMSHASRLDLSAVLTLSIIIDIPVDIFAEGILRRMHPHFNLAEIIDVLTLPLFAKTTVVSLIRRICRRELLEMSGSVKFISKPVRSVAESWPLSIDVQRPASFAVDPTGYRHLRYCKMYLDNSSATIGAASYCKFEVVSFSDLELELLRILPDVPTRTDSVMPESDGADAYSSWVSLSARHSIILIARSINIPSFTRPQTSKTDQVTYEKLLPALHAAKMSYSDLDIQSTGPDIDGRPTNVKYLSKGTDKKYSGSSSSSVLPFGAGIPKGKPNLLSWNKNPNKSRLFADVPAENSAVSIEIDAISAAQRQPPMEIESFLSTVESNVLPKFDDDHVTPTASPFIRQQSEQTFQIEEYASSSKVVHPFNDVSLSTQAQCIVKKPKTVSGFSADTNWDSSFLLAPDTTIQEHNSTVRESDGWRHLDQPPVVLQLNGHISCLDMRTVSPTGGHDDDDDRYRDDTSEGSEHSEVSVQEVEGLVQEKLNKIEWDDSIQESSPITSPRLLRKSMSADSTSYPKKLSQEQKWQQQEKLLKEMGTLRNVRELAGFNKELVTSAKHQQAHTNRRRQKMNLLAQKLAPVGYMPEASMHSLSTSLTSFPKEPRAFTNSNQKHKIHENWISGLRPSTEGMLWPVYFALNLVLVTE